MLVKTRVISQAIPEIAHNTVVAWNTVHYREEGDSERGFEKHVNLLIKRGEYMSNLETFVHFLPFFFNGCDAFHNVHTANGVKHLEIKDEGKIR